MKKTSLLYCRLLFFTAMLLAPVWLPAQHTMEAVLTDQYDQPIEDALLKAEPSGVSTHSDSLGHFSILAADGDSVLVTKEGYESKAFKAGISQTKFVLEKKFNWKDLLNPLFYIRNGGLWLLLFIVFAETGLMVGFFLPGDSLLFVAGIYSSNLIATFPTGAFGDVADLIILWILISACGILGNMVGYWFGKKSGPFLYSRKETFFFKQKHLTRARDFYDKHGGQAIVFARFLPIIRTFAPIVAGIVGMDRKKFMLYNIIGCVAWVFAMLFAGHYLQQLFLVKFNFDLTRHLEPIVIIIVLITTLPVLYKLFFGKRAEQQKDEPGKA